MSGLSANTYSWGGDGSRFRGGGDGSFGAMSSLGTLEKNLSIPFISPGSSDSDSEGGGGERDEREDKSEASSLAILVAGGGTNAPVLILFSRVLAGEGAFGGAPAVVEREEMAEGSW